MWMLCVYSTVPNASLYVCLYVMSLSSDKKALEICSLFLRSMSKSHGHGGRGVRACVHPPTGGRSSQRGEDCICHCHCTFGDGAWSDGSQLPGAPCEPSALPPWGPQAWVFAALTCE